MKETVIKYPLTPLDYRIIMSFNTVTFLPGSWDKKFCRRILPELIFISEKQRQYMIKLFHKYRRQITNYEVLSMELEPEKYGVKITYTLFGPEIIIEKTKQ